MQYSSTFHHMGLSHLVKASQGNLGTSSASNKVCSECTLALRGCISCILGCKKTICLATYKVRGPFLAV